MSDATTTGTEPPARSHETEPLLGRPGALKQQEDASFWRNLFMGTGFLAQIGLFILVARVSISVFSLDLSLFSVHPTLNSVGVLFLIESVILLQPTHTQYQKRTGAIIHSILVSLAIVLFLGAFVAIYLNKIKIHHAHFDSPHAIIGLTTYICIFLQAIVGIAQFYTPGVFGSVDRAKAIYKYHRAAGYIIQILLLSTVLAATRTTFALGPLHFKTWQVAVSVVLILLGLLPRVKKEKFGFRTR